MLASASRDRGLLLRATTPRDLCVRKRLFRRDAESPSRTGISTRDARATPSKPHWTILHNKFPPTPRVGLVCPATSKPRDSSQMPRINRSSWAHRPALILLFAKKFFRGAFKESRLSSRHAVNRRLPKPSLLVTSRMRWTGQIFWLLASDACAASHLLPAFTSETFRRLAQWEVVSSYSSATAPDFHGISCADPLFQARKELGPRTSGLRSEGQDYLISCQPMLSCQTKSRQLWLSNQRFLDFARNDNKPCALSFT